jgi:hypothetical protein
MTPSPNGRPSSPRPIAVAGAQPDARLRVLGTFARKPPARMELRYSLERSDSKIPRPRAWLAICRLFPTSASRATGSG